MRKRLLVGDTVRLRAVVARRFGVIGEEAKKTAHIVRTHRDVAGGVVLDAPFDGFRLWNRKDLAFAGRRKQYV